MKSHENADPVDMMLSYAADHYQRAEALRRRLGRFAYSPRNSALIADHLNSGEKWARAAVAAIEVAGEIDAVDRSVWK